MLPESFGKYIVDRRIGYGGMATVYAAHNPLVDQCVAIKTIHPHLIDDEKFSRRFRQEAKLLASLRNEHIVRFLDFDLEKGQPYLVMEYLGGGSLAQQLVRLHASGDRLAGCDMIQDVQAIADALDYAHRRSMIHRDIKPANILFTEEGKPVVTDFGITKVLSETLQLSATGSILGTPAYMAPEQISGGEVDARTDIYALGIMVYEMVAGRVPFQGTTPTEIMLKQVNQAPLPPSEFYPHISPPVQQVILKALAKDPADRYHSAGEFAEAFCAAMQSPCESPVETPAESETVIDLVSPEEKTVLDTPPSGESTVREVSTPKEQKKSQKRPASKKTKPGGEQAPTKKKEPKKPSVVIKQAAPGNQIPTSEEYKPEGTPWEVSEFPLNRPDVDVAEPPPMEMENLFTSNEEDNPIQTGETPEPDFLPIVTATNSSEPGRQDTITDNGLSTDYDGIPELPIETAPMGEQEAGDFNGQPYETFGQTTRRNPLVYLIPVGVLLLVLLIWVMASRSSQSKLASTPVLPTRGLTIQNTSVPVSIQQTYTEPIQTQAQATTLPVVTPDSSAQVKYSWVSGASGIIHAPIPQEWTDIDPLGSLYPNLFPLTGEELVAAPNLNQFKKLGGGSGALIALTSNLIEPEPTLDMLVTELNYDCTRVGRSAYQRSGYEGWYDLYTDCGSHQTTLYILAAKTLEYPIYFVVFIQAQSPGDVAAAQKIMNEVTLTP